MAIPILATKLYIPPLPHKAVIRPRLIEQLTEGVAMGRRMTLIAAPAGFGKSTLASAWIVGCGRSIAWLSLDKNDRDTVRFLAYLVRALQGIAPKLGLSILNALQLPQLPPIDSILTALLNEIADIPDTFILVLDDYHLVGAKPIDEALTLLAEHAPPRMHLVITTREEPALPLPRLRARNRLTEIRAADLRFTPSEVAEFLNQAVGLSLSEAEVTTLERRTEGWIAGLQLAAQQLFPHSAGRHAHLVSLSSSLRGRTARPPGRRAARFRYPLLHRRASGWYAQNGMVTDAIHHALAGGDFEQAAHLIELASSSLRRSRQEALILNWLKALPNTVFHNRPVLNVAYALALLVSGEIRGMEERLRNAEQWLNVKPSTPMQPGMIVVDAEPFRRLPGMIALARAGLAMAHGDAAGAATFAQQALDLAPDDDHATRGGSAGFLGLVAWTNGELETAHQTFASGMAHFVLDGNIAGAIILADIRSAQGRLH